jgi:peptidoglycan biosynthesis protein MviN/MurJ (putative lipid II flippase)
MKHNVTYKKRMIQGAIAGLVLILFFLLSGNKPHPDWKATWWLKPLFIVPFAGAMGGVWFHILSSLQTDKGLKKILLYVLGFIGVLVALWMGMVVGLDGTFWN